MPEEIALLQGHAAQSDQDRLDRRSKARIADQNPGECSHVAILMATYNGERFLDEQLASIRRQTHWKWSLHISDDGSKDATLAMLEDAQVSWGGARLRAFRGPGKGFVFNFLSLACSESIKADFFAWCDQDDIWCDDKLEAALKWLRTIPEGTPALYCGRTEMISEYGEPIGRSPLFAHPPGFANALVQNIGGGNTMVFNKAARALLQEAGRDVSVPYHDWWAYQLISGAGGVIHYDPEPKVLYRQHGENVIGSNSNWSARVVRMRMVFRGRFREWNEQAINALETMQHRLTREHQATLEHFKAARHQTLPFRIASSLRAGLYRQTLFGNLGLGLAILLKKI